MNLFLSSPTTPPDEKRDSSATVSVREILSRMAITKRKVKKLDASFKSVARIVACAICMAHPASKLLRSDCCARYIARGISRFS